MKQMDPLYLALELQKKQWLVRFIAESNRIEGISPDVLDPKTQLALYESFLDLEELTVKDLTNFVNRIQPAARLRDAEKLDVMVGNHIPPKGGPHIVTDLQAILDAAMNREDPYVVHCRYENLHPFMDGNGRSGRAVWAWQRRWQSERGLGGLGFLHWFYYRGLDHYRETH